MLSLRATTLFILGSLGVPAAALAATPTYYVDRPTFEATLRDVVRDDYQNGYQFAQSNEAMSAVRGETDYVTTGHAENNLVFGAGDLKYCAGCNGSFRLIFTSTSVGTASGVFGVGLDIGGNDAGVPYYAFVTFADGTTADIALPVGASFWAVTAPELIANIHFGLSGGAPTTNGSFFIDNLTIGDSLRCSNGVVDAGEECDDGNHAPGDGCSATCMLEYCGNGLVEPGEGCDDGNNDSGDGCQGNCTLPACGDGFLDGGEACDDGNTVNGDDCPADCL